MPDFHYVKAFQHVERQAQSVEKKANKMLSAERGTAARLTGNRGREKIGARIASKREIEVLFHVFAGALEIRTEVLHFFFEWLG